MGKKSIEPAGGLPAGLQWNPNRGFIIDKVIWGERIKKTLGFCTRVNAEVQFEKIVSEARKGSYIPESIARSLTVTELLNRYYVEQLSKLPSEKSRKDLLTVLVRLLGDKKVMLLKKRDIDMYIKIRLNERKVIYCVKRDERGRKVRAPDGSTIQEIRFGKPISKSTIKHELAELKIAINYLVEIDELPKTPLKKSWFKGLRISRPKKIILDYGRDMGSQFLNIYRNVTGNWYWRLFYLTLYETGMRPKELKNMRVNWVSEIIPGCYQIEVPASEEKTENQDRRIPISQRLLKRLLPHLRNLKGDEYIFKSRVKEGPIEDHDKQFNRALKKAGLDKSGITVYSLRRTRATIWSAIDDLASRVALGHALIDPHEESYVVVTPERLFKLVGTKIDTRELLKVYKKCG